MIYTNTGATIPATLTDAPTAYKDGVTDALWHPAVTLTFGREITDAEIAALLAGSGERPPGRWTVSHGLHPRRAAHPVHSISITLPYTTKDTQESPTGLQQEITGRELALAAAEQRYTAAVLHAAAEGGTT